MVEEVLSLDVVRARFLDAEAVLKQLAEELTTLASFRESQGEVQLTLQAVSEGLESQRQQLAQVTARLSESLGGVSGLLEAGGRLLRGEQIDQLVGEVSSLRASLEASHIRFEEAFARSERQLAQAAAEKALAVGLLSARQRRRFDDALRPSSAS